MKNKISRNRKKPAIKKSIKEKSLATSKEVLKADIPLGMHNLRAPAGSHKRRKLLGRGPSSGHGKTSTRGSKGQTSRSGRDFYLGFEGGQTPLIRRIPKRGFTNRFKKEYQIINLDDLSRIKEPTISIELLEEKGLIKDSCKLVKILGNGEIKNPVTIQAHAVSQKAADKITHAGGKIELIKLKDFSKNPVAADKEDTG